MLHIKKYENNSYLFFVITLFLIVTYFFSIGQDPILGDSLAFTVQAYNGFDFTTNATNHFLYSNFLALTHKIISCINPHYLFVFISIIFSIGTLIGIKKFLLLFDISDKISNVLVLLFGVSFTYWRISIITEVYAFYMFFAVLFLYNSFKYLESRKNKYFIKLSFFLGILFLIHIQSILFLLFYLVLILENYKSNTKQTLFGIILFVFISSILLIPVFQGKHNFLAILNDNAYQDSFFNFNPSVIIKSFIKNIGFLIYNFLFFLYFIFFGYKNIKYKKYILFIFIPFIVFILKHNVSDSYVFHLVPYIFLLIAIGKGIESKLPNFKIGLVLIIPLFYFVTYQILGKTSFGEKMNTEIGFKGGVRYFFYPPLSGNPEIESFVKAYQQKKLKDIKTFDRQYELALEWLRIKKYYKQN
jgi:hypothetical protein